MPSDVRAANAAAIFEPLDMSGTLMLRSTKGVHPAEPMINPTDKSQLSWLTSLRTHEGMPLALRVRPHLDTAANREAFPHLAVITHELEQVTSNGLPADDYNQSLLQFDLDLQAAVSGGDGGLVLLVETFAGKRSYHGAVAEVAGFESRMERLRTGYPQHALTVAVRADKAWTFLERFRSQFP